MYRKPEFCLAFSQSFYGFALNPFAKQVTLLFRTKASILVAFLQLPTCVLLFFLDGVDNFCFFKLLVSLRVEVTDGRGPLTVRNDDAAPPAPPRFLLLFP